MFLFLFSQVEYPIITKCKCSSFTCPGGAVSDFGMITRDVKPKKRSVLEELDELDQLDRMAAKPRKRKAINLHELGSLADMVKQKRSKLNK